MNNCTACKRPSNELKEVTSKVLKGARMFLCPLCIDNKNEPRGYIILAARERGPEFVKAWIKHHRYHGSEITLKELI